MTDFEPLTEFNNFAIFSEDLCKNVALAESLAKTKPSVESCNQAVDLKKGLELDLKYFKQAITDWTKVVNKVKPDSEKDAHEKHMRLFVKEDFNRRSLSIVEKTIELTCHSLDKLIEKCRALEKSSEPENRTDSKPIADRGVPAQPVITNNGESVLPLQIEMERLEMRPRLPPLPTPSLPIFYGERTEFSAWWERFREMIHSRPDISHTEKMSYLRQSLQNSAKQIIDQFPSSTQGYEDAIALLCESFSANKADEMTMVRKLEGIVAVNESWPEQMNLTLALKVALTSLGKLNKQSQDLIVQNMVLQKFSGQMRNLLCRYLYGNVNVTLRAVLDKAESVIREELFLQEMEKSSVKEKGNSQSRHAVSIAKEDSKLVSPPSQTQKSRSSPKEEGTDLCLFCNKHKESFRCRTMKMVKDRIAHIKQLGLCVACLKPNGSMHTCSNKCHYCQGPHDMALCYEFVTMYQSNQAKTQQNKRQASRKHTEIQGYSYPQGRQPNQDNRILNHGGQTRFTTNVNRQAPLQPSHHTIPHAMSSRSRPRLQIGRAAIANGRKKRTVDFLLDTGASVSLISETLAEEMGLPRIDQAESTLTGLGGHTRGTQRYNIYEVSLKGAYGNSLTIQAMGYPDPIIEGIEPCPLPPEDSEYIKSHRLKLSDDSRRESKVQPSVLLGNKDYLNAIKWKKRSMTLPSGYTLLPSVFGWIATGDIGGTNGSSHIVSHVTDKKVLNETLHRFLAVEEVGNRDEPMTGQSQDMKKMVDTYFRQNVQYQKGRIQARYCFNTEKLSRLSVNQTSCVARLRNVVNSLRRRNMLSSYDKVIKNRLAEGHIERVDHHHWPSRVSYLPHHPVFRPDKPNKPIRVVFDASARERWKLSLNDCLYAGESHLERIPALLIRARTHAMIILADVESAFLQIGIHEDQRDLMRLVWVKDPEKPICDDNLECFRFTVTPFGVAQSPFILESSIRFHLEQVTKAMSGSPSPEKKTVISQLRDNIYVDNLLFSCDETVKKQLVYKEAKSFFAGIHMNLREFTSNDTAFVESLPMQDRGIIGVQKMLGVHWSSEEDKFLLSAKIPDTDKLSKRTVLQKLASTFDPLGLVAPLLLPAKIYIQELWRKECGWDTPLSSEDKVSWAEIEKQMKAFQHSIPRQIFRAKGSKWKLAAFADASSKAMAAVIYSIGDKNSSIVMARSQLAPLKNPLTIPRLEHRAILLAMHSLLFVVKSLSSCEERVEECTVFSDSVIALYWTAYRIKDKISRSVINTSKKIADLRKEICQEVGGEEKKALRFCHVPSEDNPADLASRGCAAKKLKNSSIWWNGPEWLSKSHSRPEFDPDRIAESAKEEAKQLSARAPVLIISSQEVQVAAVKFERFSSFTRLTRTVAFVNRFIRLKFASLSSESKAKLYRIIGHGSVAGSLTTEEIDMAKKCIFKMHQHVNLGSIKDPGSRRLELFQDGEGLFRCGHSRLQNARIPYDEKFPIFMPSGSDAHLVKTLIMHVHRSYMHAGENHTISAIRSRLWIPRARRLVQSVLRKCVPCRKMTALPFPYPKAPDLPESRVNVHRVFEHTGLDFAGPFAVQDHDSREKIYILLLTCLTTRAVHLEPTERLSAPSFMMALRRFIARRGALDYIVSDNASTFKCVSNLLTQEGRVADGVFQTFLSSKGVSWHFIPPYSPWQGGAYERLVGVMKQCVMRTFGRKVLAREEFMTVITEVEAVVNSRPLTRLSDDFKDTPFGIIRPQDFLCQGANLGFASRQPVHLGDKDYVSPDSTTRTLAIQHRESDELLQRHWKNFQKTYLTSLKDRQSSSLKTGRSGTRSPIRGEVVLLMETNTPRGSWPLAQVIECHEREAILISSSGKKLVRPLSMIVPIEVYGEDNIESLAIEKAKPQRIDSVARPSRSCKSAARDPEFWRAMLD